MIWGLNYNKVTEEKSMQKTMEKNNSKHGVSLATRILAGGLAPIILMAVSLTVISTNSVRSGVKSEAFDTLSSVATSINAGYNAIDSGDYTVSGDNLMKGNTNITEATDIIDSFKEGNDLEITIFYGDVRYATTLKSTEDSKRIVGTKASDGILTEVLKGQIVTDDSLAIDGKNYYASYSPLKNSDGSIVGMIFTGKPSEDVNKYINQKTMIVVSASIIITIIAIVIIMLVTISIKRAIKAAEKDVKELASGKLNIEIDKKSSGRSDELGDMVRSIELLKNELVDVTSNIKKSSGVLGDAGKELSDTASQTSATADEISTAVEDISKGAVSQAEEIENASNAIDNMGRVIENIVNSVAALDRMSVDMKKTSDKASTIMNELSTSNDRTMDAIDRISAQITATNDSALKISEAIQIITGIAEETNLLSLNASIEAARAGEQGKGFAVVANQIQKLAEQSNESALKIAETVTALMEDSENTVVVMGEVKEIVDEQKDKLELTKKQFNFVHKGIEDSRSETELIKEQTEICDNGRKKVVDVISNLSAISEENAASTQETTASMQELNATINLLAESSSNLLDLSEDLKKHVNFFHV